MQDVPFDSAQGTVTLRAKNWSDLGVLSKVASVITPRRSGAGALGWGLVMGARNAVTEQNHG